MVFTASGGAATDREAYMVLGAIQERNPQAVIAAVSEISASQATGGNSGGTPAAWPVNPASAAGGGVILGAGPQAVAVARPTPLMPAGAADQAVAPTGARSLFDVGTSRR